MSDELKQTNIELETPPSEKILNEAEIRALLKSELANYRGVMRIRSGYLSAGGTEITPAGISIGEMLPTSEVSIQNWANTLTFSAVDHDTVEWNAGVITLANGKFYSITAGNTGDMSTITYIYLDVAVSETVLQTTTTQSNAVGSGKILVAVAKNNADVTSDPQLQVYGGSVNSLFTSDNIAANTITANEIASNTITAAEMNVSQLSAISADMGTITAGSITSVTYTAKGGGSGIDTKIDSADGVIKFYYGTDKIGYLSADTNQDVTLDADNDMHLQADDIYLDYNDDNAGGNIYIRSNDSTKWSFDQSGDFVPNTDNDVDIGSSSKQVLKGWFEDIDVDDLVVNTGCTGCAYKEFNLLTGEQKAAFTAERLKPKEERKKGKKKTMPFDEGEVLAWKNGKLVKAKLDTCKCVCAVADKMGMPIILGQEMVKVIGTVKENDFIVTSITEGCGRAWTSEIDPPRGTIIAQASQDKESEESGLILARIQKF